MPSCGSFHFFHERSSVSPASLLLHCHDTYLVHANALHLGRIQCDSNDFNAGDPLVDQGIILFLNHFAAKSWAFDSIINMIVRSDVIRGGLMVAMFTSAWYWGTGGTAREENRRRLIAALIGTVVALVIARLIVIALPFKPRPINDPALSFVIPFGMTPETVRRDSSFPSDTSALYFGLATGVLLVSRRLGLLAYSFAALVIALPRIYLGIHYPIDIVAGAGLGAFAVLLANLALLRTPLPRAVCNWARLRPAVFFPILFLLSFEMASTFDDARDIVSLLINVIVH